MPQKMVYIIASFFAQKGHTLEIIGEKWYELYTNKLL